MISRVRLTCPGGPRQTVPGMSTMRRGLSASKMLIRVRPGVFEGAPVQPAGHALISEDCHIGSAAKRSTRSVAAVGDPQQPSRSEGAANIRSAASSRDVVGDVSVAVLQYGAL